MNPPSEVKITFPVYRYHPKEDMGHGAVSCLKMNATPYPVADSWNALKLNISGKRLEYLRSDGKGTNGLGLFLSWSYLTISQVLPGGILDAAGRHTPILDYDGTDEPRGTFRETLASISELTGKKYNHRFTFGQPEQLDLECFKERILKYMFQQKGFARPVSQIKSAQSFSDVMRVEFGDVAVERFLQEQTFPNWVRA